MSLKISCLRACGNDMDKAQKLYGFIAEGLRELPDFDTKPPTLMQQATDTVGSIFGWVKENQGDIMQAWDFVRSMLGRGAAAPTAGLPAPPVDVPPIPEPK